MFSLLIILTFELNMGATVIISAAQCPAQDRVKLIPCSCENLHHRSDVSPQIVVSCTNISALRDVRESLRHFSSPPTILGVEGVFIPEIPADAFLPLCINHLVIQFHDLLLINESAFSNLGHCLHSLTISGGNLTDVPDISISKLTHLEVLEISKNLIEKVRVGILNERLNLRMLNFGLNRISSIEVEAFPANLLVLNLEFNFLNSLNGSLRHLENLEQLRIGNNGIVSLSDDLLGLSQLKWLKADNNIITDITDSFEHLSKLIELDLSYNQITKLDKNLRSLTNLKKLNLRHNLLASLSEFEFATLTNLKELDLSQNKFSSLGSSLVHLEQLRNLNLSAIMVTTLADAKLDCLSDLTNLDISKNLLKNVDILDLFGAAIPSKEDSKGKNTECIVRGNNQLKRINITGNHWACDFHFHKALLKMAEMNMTIVGSIC